MTEVVTDLTNPVEDPYSTDHPWVSPDVVAARAGERVEMGQVVEEGMETG